MTTEKKIQALNWYDLLGKLKVILIATVKKEDGISGTFVVSGFTYTITNGQITSKVAV